MAITASDDRPELAKYELQERIGHGGMATVYRAEDRRLGRDVAVKLIHPHLRGNREVAARFVSEARAVAKLKHPNIVEVYDISDEAEAERYLVVELIEGPTLRQLLEQRGALPPEVAAVIGLQLAAALGHAHDQQIVHRDVKPENVLIDTPKRTSRPNPRDDAGHVTVKLTDFGIAKLLDAHGVTSTGQVLGSPAHMAPEQIEGGAVGPRADVFGLGVLLFEAMTGKLPFDGANPAQVLRKVLDGEHEPAVRVRPQVGARWSALLDRALAKNPEERFASIEDLAMEMKAGLYLLGFKDGQPELDAYLADPDEYEKRHAERIVEALAGAGEAARARGDVGLASDSFNRALSYRPGDPELLSRVSSVARGERLKSVVRVVAIGAAAIGVAAAAWSLWPSQVVAPMLKTERASPPSKKATSAPTTGRVTPPASAEVSSAATATRHPTLRTTASPAVRQKPVNQDPVKVSIHYEGAKGGELYINGENRGGSFQNGTVELSPGTYTFAFKLKDPNCCNEPSVTAKIGDGEANAVTLSVTYRNANLRVDGPPGKLSCRALFSDPLVVPGSIGVRMNDPEETEECTYVPDDSTASRPWSGSVRLRAGQSTVISVP